MFIVVEGMLKWIAEEKEKTNRQCEREAVFKYSYGDIKRALWNNLTKLKENKWYIQMWK